jgi:imidazolonepropionase-like amidohydrolase
MRRACFALLFPIIVTINGLAQEAGKPPKASVIKAGRLLDVRAGRVFTDRAILVEGERIKSVGEADEILKTAPKGAAIIDLSKATVLPGLIDCHTHVLLQGDITQADYDEQLLKESIPFRTIRATVAARTALMNGFTAMRDLETEGAMYADVDVKRAIGRGIIPAGLLVGVEGPRGRAGGRRARRDPQGRPRAGQARGRLDQVLLRPQVLSRWR